MNREPAIPQGMEIISGISSVILRRVWRSWAIIPMAVFAIAWDSFLVFWYSMAFGDHKAPWIMIVFPIGHVAVGLGLTYFVFCSLFNKTDVEISGNGISVKTYPLPWFSNKTVLPENITGIRVKYTSNNNNHQTFEIRYRTPENREKRLMSGLTDDQAQFIEYHIRKMLSLPAAQSEESA